jgi:hypothetical protein
MPVIWRAGRGSARVLVRTVNFCWLAVTGGVGFLPGLCGVIGLSRNPETSALGTPGRESAQVSGF